MKRGAARTLRAMAETAPPTAETPPAQKPSGKKRVKESIWEVYYPRDVEREREAVPVASFPMIIYFWPTMVFFLLCAVVQGLDVVAPTTIGLWATSVWALNLLVIVADLDQKKFTIVMLLFAVFVLLAWVSSLKDMGFLSGLSSWIGGLQVTYSTHAFLVIGTLLFVLTFFGLIQPRFNYWRIEANEFVHYIQPWGRDQSIPRQGSTVTREVPDVLELLLTFGGGTLVIKREGEVVARIDHVPFLSRRMKAIERLLGATRVTVSTDES